MPSYTTNINIKRFQNLLETSVDERERQTMQKLLTEEILVSGHANVIPKKVRPALGGEPAAREPGLGTGRGGDVTGVAYS